jgi:toxin ParE1/3/4
MRQLWQPKAISDLDAIRDYSRREWGREQALKYIRAMQRAVRASAKVPMATAPADHLKPGYRKINVGSHLILFRIVDNTMEIARILHGSMDLPMQLDDQF